MFLNFMLSKEVRPYCDVDISNARTEEEWEKCRLEGWERWERNMMELTDSPYRVFQAMPQAKDMALGDKQDPYYPFGWSRVVRNFPGTPTYDCC